MKYRKILSSIAKQNKTTASEVEKEMKKALSDSGLNISPEEFIIMVVKHIKDSIS